MLPARHPLLGAQELIVVLLRRYFGCELRVGARCIGVLAFVRQSLRARLFVDGSFHRLHEAAGAEQQRGGERRAEYQPWTSRDHCHTLHSSILKI